MSLGGDFYLEATQPGRVMFACLQRGDVAAALNAVHYDSLVCAFHMAVGRVRRQAGVGDERVVALLPEVEMHAAVVATTHSQQRAVAIWNQHQSSLVAVVGRLLGAVVEVHLGIQGLGIGDALASVTNSSALDVRVKGPMTELQTALGTYDQWLRWCASTLDADPWLNRAWRRARWRRRAVATLVVMAAVAAVTWAGCRWREGQASDESAGSEAATGAGASVEPSSGEPSSAPPTSPLPASSAAARPRPVRLTPAPASRPACLRACVARCSDDSNCERACAAGCPLP
jgi:hypothetical protein